MITLGRPILSRQMRFRRKGKSIEDIIQEECGKRKVSEEELRKGNRRTLVIEVRAAIAHRSKEELRVSGAEIAPHLGVNTSSINRALAKMDQLRVLKVMHRVRIDVPKIMVTGSIRPANSNLSDYCL